VTGDDASGADDGDGADVVRRERFSGGPARSFLSSLAADERIFAADLAVDRAHVVMLAERGIVDAGDARAILDALDAVEAAGHDALPDGEDVHAAIETAVVERAGDAGRRMHTARSRNDEVATCIRYRLREDLLGAVEATLGLREALVETAAAHDDTVMAGYTHLQTAQPTTLAQHHLSYAAAAERDAARLLDAYDRTNRSPLGAAAFAGTPFDVDRERTAALLGFDGVAWNATDAVSARDFLVESVAALAGVALTCSGLAEDLVLFANQGALAPDDDYASTSSIMPQKVNPDTLELVRATAGDAAAGLQGLVTTLKGLPRAYNRDLQRATPHAWEVVDAVTEAVDVTAGAVATATWDEAALAAAADEGFATATGVADLLAAAGVPFRSAHEVVATAAQAVEAGDDEYAAVAAAVESVLGESLGAVVDPTAVEAVLDAAESVRRRDSAGGPAPDAVRDQLARAREGLDADRTELSDRRAALAESRDRLATAVEGVR